MPTAMTARNVFLSGVIATGSVISALFTHPLSMRRRVSGALAAQLPGGRPGAHILLQVLPCGERHGPPLLALGPGTHWLCSSYSCHAFALLQHMSCATAAVLYGRSDVTCSGSLQYVPEDRLCLGHLLLQSSPSQILLEGLHHG